MEDLAWFLERNMKKLILYIAGDTRPASEPYISGDTFRSIANHVFEKRGDDSTWKLVQPKDIIFVSSNQLHHFFEKIHPKIKCPYVLISHNGAENIPEEYVQYIDEKIIHWYAQNATFTHEKVTLIPTGIENLGKTNRGLLRLYQESSTDLHTIKDRQVEEIRKMRKSRILYSFKTATNPKERNGLLTALKDCDSADELNRGIFIAQPSYIHMLRSYLFVVSPAGISEDCYRTWEALYTGTIPIVKKSTISLALKDAGIPLYIVEDWHDICDVSKYELIALYDTLWQNANIDALYFEHWKTKILSHK